MTPRVSHALVVEDDDVIARSLQATLVEHLGVPDVEIAGSVAQVRAALERRTPGLILLDLGLPDGTGFDVLDLVERGRVRPIVVVVTVFDDDDHLFAALGRGIDGYVLKEDRGVELTRIVTDILDGRPPLSAAVARRILDEFRIPERPHGEELTPREREVVRLIAEGSTVAAAASALEISAHTVQHHVKNVYQKLGISTRAQLTRRAIELGII